MLAQGHSQQHPGEGAPRVGPACGRKRPYAQSAVAGAVRARTSGVDSPSGRCELQAKSAKSTG